MSDVELRRQVRSSMIAFACRLLEQSGKCPDVLEVSPRSAYDALGWYAKQDPFGQVASYYFHSERNEVQHFLDEWAIWQRVQRCLRVI